MKILLNGDRWPQAPVLVHDFIRQKFFAYGMMDILWELDYQCGEGFYEDST